MNNQITYDDKVALNENPLIPNINKCKADDMNEIKNKHNGCMNGSIPMGNVVVDSIRSKNILAELNAGDVTNFAVGQVPSFSSSLNRATVYPIFIEVSSNKSYSVSINTGYEFALIYCDIDKQTIDSTQYITSSTIDTGNNIKYICIKVRKPDNTDFTSSELANIKCQIEEGTTPTPYKTYQGLGYIYGGNQKGYYRKYDDGTLVQWGSQTFNNITTPNSAGALYRSDYHAGLEFPLPFKSIEICNEFIQGTYYTRSMWFESEPSLTRAPAWYLYNTGTGSTPISVTVGFFAIGRWK